MAILKKEVFPKQRLRATQVDDILSVDGKTYSVSAGLRPLLTPWDFGIEPSNELAHFCLKQTTPLIMTFHSHDANRHDYVFRSFAAVAVNAFTPYKGKLGKGRFKVCNARNNFFARYNYSYSSSGYYVSYWTDYFKSNEKKIVALQTQRIFEIPVNRFPGNSYYNYSIYLPLLVEDTAGKYGVFVLNDFPVYQSRYHHSYLALVDKVNWPNISATTTLLKYDYITGIPVVIGESNNYLYINNSSSAIKQASILKIDTSGTKSLVIGYTQASFPMSITSIISKPEKDDSGVFHWYKYVYEAVTDESGNTTYVPKIAYCSYNPAADEASVVYEDCTVTLPAELDLQNYIDSAWGCGAHVVNVEKIEKDGKAYLLVMVMNMGQVAALTPDYNKHYGMDSRAFIQEDAVKMHLFAIDSNDPKTLNHVGSQSLPWDTIYVAPPKEDGAWVEDGFIVWTPYYAQICSLTFDSNVFEVQNTIKVPAGNYIKAFGTDGQRIYVLLTNDNLGDTNTNTSLLVWGDKIPEDVKITPEKEYYNYQGSPIDTYALVDVLNYKNKRISAKVRLRILTNNAVFKDTNSSVIEITTSETASTQVNFTVVAEGSIKIAVESVRVL